MDRLSRSFVHLPLLLLLLGLVRGAAAQSPSSADSTTWRLESSTGYYTQEGTRDSGVGLFVNVGRRLSTGFIGSLGFGIAQTYSRYGPRDPLFSNDRHYRSHYIFRLSFDYPFELSRQHHLLLGTGVVFVQRYWTHPIIRARQGPDEQTVFISGNSDPVTPNVAGLHFTVKYSYQISRLSLGLRADAHLFQFERGGEYIVAPFLGVHF